MTNLIPLLNGLSPWLLAFLLIAAAEVFSIGLMVLCRLRWGQGLLSLNNEVAGFKFAVVGVLYAVILAFVVVAVWQNYADTETAVRKEATTVLDLHRLSFVLPEPDGTSIRRHAYDYVTQVRDLEWPAMARGLSSPAAARELADLSQAIFDGRPEALKDLALYQYALSLLTAINDNRSERLESSDGSVPPVLWLALLAGGAITLAYPAFFGSSNPIAQILMTAALAALVALTLFVALVLDFPFSGEVRISDAPFGQALAQMRSQ